MDFRDDLFFLAITVYMEAGGEIYNGKVAVAFTIVNRGTSIIDTVLRSFQFSAWNTDSPTRMNIDTISDPSFRDCYKATCAAYFRLTDDPTLGATHYLNEEVTKKLRGGVLPAWFDEAKVRARIGNHTFLKLS